MITFVRTATVAPGKQVDALQFAKKVTELVTSKHGVETVVSSPIGGNPMSLAWVSAYASLAEFEVKSAGLLGDPEYQAMVASAAGYFLPGSISDQLWRSF